MNGELFTKAHQSIKNLLMVQKAQMDLNVPVKIIEYLIRDGKVLSDEGEYNATRCQILIGTRVAAEMSIQMKRFDSEQTLFARLVKAVLQEPLNFKEDDTCLLKWSRDIFPLMSCLLSSNCSEDILLEAIKLLSELASTQMTEEFYALQSFSLIGKLTAVSLDCALDEKRNPDIRLSSFSLLSSLFLPPHQNGEVLQRLTVVFPGIVSKLSLWLSQPGTKNSSMIAEALKLLYGVITVCLDDGSYDEKTDDISHSEKDSFLVKRNLKWAKSSSENMKKMISRVCAGLCIHRDENVRFHLISGSLDLFTNCSVICENILDEMLYDLVLLMCADESNRVSKVSDRLLLSIRDKRSSQFSVYIRKKLLELSERFPIAIRRKEDPGPIMKQITSIIHCMADDLLPIVACRENTIIATLRSLASSVRINRHRICLNRNEDSSTVSEFLKELPLMYGMTTQSIVPFCRLFAENCASESLDVLNELITDSSSEDKISFLLISSYCIDYTSIPSTSNHSFSGIAEYCTDILEKSFQATVTREDMIQDLGSGITPSDIETVIAMCCLSRCFQKIGEGAEQSQLLKKSIYRIIQQSEAITWIVKDTADMVLYDLAKNSHQSVSNFLMDNSMYIISKVDIASRSLNIYSEAPSTLTALLNRVEDKSLFDHVRHIVANLLLAVDLHSQVWTLIVLRSLSAFLTAMNRWFPSIEPLPMDRSKSAEEEDILDMPKPPVPDEILSVEGIMQRTKHLLLSKHFPNRIIVLQIANSGLTFLRNFPDQLLPMIHQNWLSLTHLLEDKELEVRRAAFEAVCTMARVSHTFVYRRVRFDAWPKISKWMLNESLRNPSLAQASIFKFTECIIARSADLWRDIEMTSEDWKVIEPVLAHFDSPSAHPRLRNLAIEARHSLENLLSKITG